MSMPTICLKCKHCFCETPYQFKYIGVDDYYCMAAPQSAAMNYVVGEVVPYRLWADGTRSWHWRNDSEAEPWPTHGQPFCELTNTDGRCQWYEEGEPTYYLPGEGSDV